LKIVLSRRKTLCVRFQKYHYNTHASLSCRERKGLERSATRALDAAKAAAADERSAWRAAVTEKIKRQAAEREEQLRALLVAERDAELQEVIRRLQAEQGAALQAAKQQVSKCLKHA
jgi:hypothetical protein